MAISARGRASSGALISGRLVSASQWARKCRLISPWSTGALPWPDLGDDECGIAAELSMSNEVKMRVCGLQLRCFRRSEESKRRCRQLLQFAQGYSADGRGHVGQHVEI